MITTNKNFGRVIYEKSDSYKKSENATSEDVMPPFSDSFIVPEGGATVVASLTVDDWGKLSISGPGGTFELIPGEYTLTVTHENARLAFW